jgi:hypothetical protein
MAIGDYPQAGSDSGDGRMARVVEELREENARLKAELDAARFADRHGGSMSSDAIHAVRELLDAHNVPAAAFIDDHVGNAIRQRDAATEECDRWKRLYEAKQLELAKTQANLEKVLNCKALVQDQVYRLRKEVEELEKLNGK